MKKKKILILIVLWGSFFFLKNSHGDTKESIGVIVNTVGKVEILRQGKLIAAQKEFPVYEIDTITTYGNSAVKIEFKDGSNYMAFQNTQFKLSEYKIKKNSSGGINLKSIIENVKGDVRFFVKPRDDKGSNDVKYTTPNAVMLIRGTTGDIDVSHDKLVVIAGTVEFAKIADVMRRVVVPAGSLVTSAQFKVRPASSAELSKNNSYASKISSPPPKSGSGASGNQPTGSAPGASQESDKSGLQSTQRSGASSASGATPVSGSAPAPVASPSSSLVINPDGTSASSNSGVSNFVQQNNSSPPKTNIGTANATSATSIQNTVNQAVGPGSSVQQSVNQQTQNAQDSTKNVQIQFGPPKAP